MGQSLAYRNIRYARSDRFESAEIVEFHEAELGRSRGPVPPQAPSRFDVLLGPQAPLEQAEDCQVLSVYTPDLTGERPVMIWFHGGAAITGGGELPWYDGTLFAAEQDVVVVSVTARLGALGYIRLDDFGQPSPATTDHMTAIEWVHRFIARFGGDPDNITLFGQSAGGSAIEVMLRWGIGQHVKGAIIQSGFLKQDGLVYKREDAAKQATAFKAALDGDPRSSSVTEILAAQAALAMQSGTVEIWAPLRPEVERHIDIPILAGCTKHDTLPFILFENDISKPEPKHFNLFAEEIHRRNRVEVSNGNFEALDDAVASGQKAWLYEFDWDIQSSGWGSPHCIELPFLLGDQEAWRAAPVLKGADWKAVRQQSRYLRTAWSAFARSRIPSTDWVEYDIATRTANQLRYQSSSS